MFWKHFISRVVQDKRGAFPFAAIPAAISAISTGMSLFGGKGDSNLEGFKLPDYYESDIFNDIQDYLKGYGTGMLEGDVPDYYKGIGETGSQEFEDMLAMTNRDISQSVTEAMAKSGRARGGALPVAVSKAVGDASTKARYGDYERSLEGKKYLMNTGLETTTGVRNAAFNEQSLKNQFNLSRSGLDLKQRGYLDDLDLQIGGMQGEGIGSFIDTIFKTEEMGGFDFIKDIFKSDKKDTVDGDTPDIAKVTGALGNIDEFNITDILKKFGGK